MGATAVVHSIAEGEETVTAEAKISRAMKQDALTFLSEHGLTPNDAFKMVLEAASMKMGVPTYWFGPSAETSEALEELDRGEGKTFSSVKELMADLYAED